MADRLSLAALQAFARTLSVGDQFTMEWSDPDDPAVVLTWRCKVTAKLTDVLAHFRSEDADEREEDFEFPNIAEGLNRPPTDADLDAHYHRVVKVPQGIGKKSMRKSKSSSLARSSILAWKPATWKTFLKPGDPYGRKLTIDTIFEQLQIPERINQQSFKVVEDYEACALGEIVIGLVDLMLAVTEEVRECHQMDNVLMAALVRLSELKAGRGKSGEARTKAMQAVRTAALGNELAHDKLTRAIMGLPLSGDSGSTNGT